jgi:hypothetical protein
MEVQLAVQRRSIIWVDAQGRTRLSVPTADPDSTAIMAALQNHSQASVIEWWEGPDIVLGGTPLGGTYPSVFDSAELTFQGPSGNVNLILPAPSLAIFKPDGVTVDPSAIADIISASTGHLATMSGALVTSFIAGIRRHRIE